MTQALHTTTPHAGPVVDLGAGTGLGTQVIADALPSAQILAVEPAAIQRAVLLARLGSDPALRDRVTVVAADADGVSLPDRLGGVVALNMIGHLNPDQRQALWQRIADRLAPGAPVVLNLQPPAEAVAVPEAVFATVRVGQHTYEGSGAAEPSGPATVTWRMRYRVLDQDGQAVRVVTAAYPWHVLSPPALLAELSTVGFEATIGPYDLVRAVVPARPLRPF